MVDEGSRRWVVAVHEAAHVVIAEALGWLVLGCTITDEDGEMNDEAPDGLDRPAELAQSATIALAGISANERQLGGVPHGCEHDEHDAAEALDELAGLGFDLPYADVQAEADALVDELIEDIITTAVELYEHGELVSG